MPAINNAVDLDHALFVHNICLNIISRHGVFETAEDQLDELFALEEVARDHDELIGWWAARVGIDALPFYKWLSIVERVIDLPDKHPHYHQPTKLAAVHEAWPAAHSILEAIVKSVTVAQADRFPITHGANVACIDRPRRRKLDRKAVERVVECFIFKSWQERDEPPTLREVMAETGYASGTICKSKAWKTRGGTGVKAKTIRLTEKRAEIIGTDDPAVEVSDDPPRNEGAPRTAKVYPSRSRAQKPAL
jgi:hypothetical protein